MFVGGLELNKRANALAAGMKSADKSFKGCLRNMEADGKLLGFPNAKVTQGVLPNCMWSFLCSKNPCIIEASCSQYGVDSFQCKCDNPVCINPDYADKYKVSIKCFYKIYDVKSLRSRLIQIYFLQEFYEIT